jgi:hypothetical protein
MMAALRDIPLAQTCRVIDNLPISLRQEDRKMAEPKQPRNYTAYQQKIIKRYYNNMDAIQFQRLAELVGELYLAEGKKKDRVWESAGAAMQKLEVPQARIDHLLKQKNPALVAELLKELENKQ